MSKFLSGRLNKLLVGILGYTENKTVVQTTGKVGIGTTDAQQHSLYVVGSTNITGDNIVGGGLTAVGIGSFQNDVYIDQELYVGGVNITGGVSLGEDITARHLNLSGIATVAGNTDLNGDLDVDGNTNLDDTTVDGTLTVNGDIDLSGNVDVDGTAELDGLNVDGATTLDGVTVGLGLTVTGNADLNGDLDVDGNTELDYLNVDGATILDGVNVGLALTVTGNIDADGGITASQATVEDLTDNRVVVAGTGGRLEDSPGLTFDGSTLAVDGDLQITGVLTYDDVTSIDSIGIITARTGIHVLNSGGIDITGVSTFAGNIDANGNLDVDGDTELDQLNVSGVSTFQSNVHVGSAITAYAATGIVSAISFYGDGANLTNTGATLNAVSGTERLVTTQLTSGTMVDAATDADLTFRASDNLLSTPNIAVSGGISTDGYDTGNQFELMRADGNGGWEWATVPGIFSVNNILNGFNVREEGLIVGTAGSIHTLDFRGLNVTASANPQPNGIATVTMSPTPTFDELYVVGVTSTNNLRVTGVSTFSSDVNLNGDINLNGNITSNVTIVSTDAGSSAVPEFKLYRNSASPADADYIGQIKFAGESDTGVERNYAKITGKILDASNGTEDGILEFAHIKNGSQNISARFRSDSLQLLNGTNFSVAGDSTFTGDITANSNIDANGDVDIAGTLDVDGHTLLDNVSISGVTTTSGLLDINAGGQANTFKVEDLTSGRVVLAGTGGELEDSGNLTFDGSTLSVTGDLSVSGTLTYDDVTNIDSIGIITARNGLHVLSGGVNIAGLSTFTGRIVGAATSNVIPFLYANLSDLPSASTYHGAFAHVHATGRAYYAHAANWYELVNKELNGDLIVGTGITMYANTGIISATKFYGDGSNLINTGATLTAASGTQRLVLTGLTSGTMVDAATDSDLAYNASDDRLIVANLDISGITTLGGPVTAGSSEGVVGQYLRNVGTGVTWANFPTLRTTQTNTATAGQTTFNFTYNTNFLDVFVNGVKLSPSEYTATNGSQIILSTAAFADEIVEFHSYNTASTYGGGGGSSYTNSDVDNHINVSGASSGEVLGWNGSDYDWVAQTAAYTNSDVDTHLNRSTAGTGEVLSWNGSDYDWVAQSSGITTAIINADTLNVSGISTFGDIKIDTAGANIEFTPNSASGSSQYMKFWVGNNSGTHYAIIDAGSGAFQIHNTSHPTGTLDFRAKEDYSFQVNGYYSIYSPSDGGVKLYHPGSQGNILSHKFETTSTGAIVTGVLTATSFSGSGSSLTGLTGASAATYGNGTAVPQITVDANGRITGITNVSISGGGGGGGTSLFIRDNGSLVGAAGTIDFGTGLSVSPVSAGIVTVTSGISTAIINADTIDSGSVNVSGISTFGDIKIEDDTIRSTGQINLITNGSSFDLDINTTDAISAGGQGVSQYVRLYGAGSEKLKTVGSGVTVTGTTFSDQLSVSGVSTFVGAIDANNNLDVAGTLTVSNTTTLNNTINIADNVVANFGASSDGRISYTSSTNRFYVRVPGGTGDLILGAGPAVRITSANGLTDRAVFTSSGVTITGTASATTFSGSGASLTTLNASELDSGTIPDARFPSTLPAVSGANLTNLPAPTPADTDVQITYDVSSNGSSAYRFTGPGYSGADDNPDIYLVRGQRYRFINGTGSSHPFRIQSDTSGTVYTDGVSGSQSGTQDFNVQHDAPARLYYQCTIHSGMIGNIYIVGGSDWRMSDVATNATPDIFTLNNVGIGTINPTESKIVISHTQTSTVKHLAIKDSTNNWLRKLGVDSSNNFGIFSGDTEHLRIDSSGNVNIGSNISSNPFTYLRFGASQYGAADIRPTDDGSHKVGLAFYTDGTQDTTINPTEALRIAANGDIGIANASPTNWGAGVPTIEIKGTVSSGGNATRSGAIAFESGSGNNGYAALWGQNGGIHIYTGATNRASATYAAQFNSSGNLAFASGNGIDFSATGNGSGTMSSELLDDYEEGSWTPDLQFGGAKVGITYNNQWGRYTKIGNMVTVIGRITLSSKGSSGGIARFFGLPYATESITGTQMSIGSLWYSNFNLQGSIVQVVIRTDSNNTSFVEPKGVTTNTEDAIGDSDFANNTDMVFTISYRTS
jgi:cytoskeletal protein CcmA (bactofilin family)